MDTLKPEMAAKVSAKSRILGDRLPRIIKKGNKKYRNISTLTDHVPPLLATRNIDLKKD